MAYDGLYDCVFVMKKYVRKSKLAQIKFFAELFTNLAAGWLGVIFITPQLNIDLFSLIKNYIFAIVCSAAAIKLNRFLI